FGAVDLSAGFDWGGSRRGDPDGSGGRSERTEGARQNQRSRLRTERAGEGDSQPRAARLLHTPDLPHALHLRVDGAGAPLPYLREGRREESPGAAQAALLQQLPAGRERSYPAALTP